MSNRSGKDDRSGDSGSAKVIYAVNVRRLEKIRFENSKIGERDWKTLSRQLENVLRDISNDRVVANDGEIHEIMCGFTRLQSLDDLNDTLTALMERLEVLAQQAEEALGRGNSTGTSSFSTGAYSSPQQRHNPHATGAASSGTGRVFLSL